jgi:hypothetical protein
MSGGDPRARAVTAADGGRLRGLGPQMSGGDPVGMGGLNFASNVAQGGAMGAPGQGFLQGVYGQQTGGPAQPMLDRLATGAEGAIPGSLAGMQATAAGGNMNVAQNPYLQSAISSGNADITRDYTNAVRPGHRGPDGAGRRRGLAHGGLGAGRRAAQPGGQAGVEHVRHHDGAVRPGARLPEPGADGDAGRRGDGLRHRGPGGGPGRANWLQSLNSQIGAAGQAGQYNQGINTALGAGQGLGGQVSGMINPYLQMYGLGTQQQQAEQAMANPQWTAFNQYMQTCRASGA